MKPFLVFSNLAGAETETFSKMAHFMWDFSRITRHFPPVHIPDMAPYRAMVRQRCAELYAKLPDVRSLAREYIPKAYEALSLLFGSIVIVSLVVSLSPPLHGK